jgi:hypothetical protein
MLILYKTCPLRAIASHWLSRSSDSSSAFTKSIPSSTRAAYSPTVKMNSADRSDMLVSIYQNTGCHTEEKSHRQICSKYCWMAVCSNIFSSQTACLPHLLIRQRIIFRNLNEKFEWISICVLFNPEDRRSTFLRNVGGLTPEHTSLRHTRYHYS